MKIKRALGRAGKLLIFFLIAALLFCLVSAVFIPKWRGPWGNIDAVAGFYELEEDSIDTFIVGSSQVISGVAPLQLYQEEGIRAYTIGSGHQPVMGSYYLLKNALLTQPNIKTVVLEVTELFVQSNEPSYRKVFDYLPLTSVKWEGIQERIRWAELQEEEQGTEGAPSAAEYVLPILAYHDRWSELTYDDFTYPFQDTPIQIRGQSLLVDQGARDTYQPLDPASTAVCAEPKAEALYFLRAFCAFCQEQGISLVLLKTPRMDWSIEQYNTVNAVAKEYSVPYLDFNTASLNRAIGFDYATDILKGSETHLNLSGAGRLTAYLGDYLTRHCPVLDVRTNPAYDWMEAETTAYRQAVGDANLALVENCSAYLSRIQWDRYSVLVAVKPGDGNAYSAGVQQLLTQLGLDPRMPSGGCYVAVLEQGTVLADQWSSGAATQSAELADSAYCTLTSTGGKTEPNCSISIDGEELAVDEPGLNLVVYNHETSRVVDSVAFTFTETEGVTEVAAER